MALSTKEVYSLTKEFTEYGATLYYMLENKTLKLDDIKNVLFKDTFEQVNLVFPSLISKIDVNAIEESKNKYSCSFTKLDCIDRIIKKDNDKHQHLKEIRNVVNLNEKIDSMIKDRTYKQAFNLFYTNKILDMLDKDTKKSYISIKDRIKLYRTALELMMDENDKKLSSNIDSYYISMITS